MINYLNTAKAIALEEKYPYKAKETGFCRDWILDWGENYAVNASILGNDKPIRFYKVQGHNSIVKYLNWFGPLAGAINTRGDFLYYNKGIFDYPASVKVTHAIILVGYGEENGSKYWIVKNSWGTEWGNEGYAKVKRGTNSASIEQRAYLFY